MNKWQDVANRMELNRDPFFPSVVSLVSAIIVEEVKVLAIHRSPPSVWPEDQHIMTRALAVEKDDERARKNRLVTTEVVRRVESIGRKAAQDMLNVAIQLCPSNQPGVVSKLAEVSRSLDDPCTNRDAQKKSLAAIISQLDEHHQHTNGVGVKNILEEVHRRLGQQYSMGMEEMEEVLDAVNQDYMNAAQDASQSQSDNLNPYITVRNGVLIPFDSKVSLRVHVVEWPPEPSDKWLDEVAPMENLIALVAVDEQYVPPENRNFPKRKVENTFRNYVHMVLQGKGKDSDIDPSFYPLFFDYGQLISKGEDIGAMLCALHTTMATVVPLSQQLTAITRGHSVPELHQQVRSNPDTRKGLKVLAPYLYADMRPDPTAAVRYRDLIGYYPASSDDQAEEEKDSPHYPPGQLPPAMDPELHMLQHNLTRSHTPISAAEEYVLDNLAGEKVRYCRWMDIGFSYWTRMHSLRSWSSADRILGLQDLR